MKQPQAPLSISVNRRATTLAISLAALLVGAAFYARNVRAEEAHAGQGASTFSIHSAAGDVRRAAQPSA